MTNDMHASEDITQEVLIKIITKLSTYNSEKAAFRTWLYRIVINYIINMNTGRKEKTISECMTNSDPDDFIMQIPDTRKPANPEHSLILREIKTTCIQCVLLVLNRRERIVFILGAVFDVNDKTGSEICEMSRDNFRQVLSRSRKKVNSFFNKNCSYFNQDNPCKCSEKEKFLLKTGMIDPGDLAINRESCGSIAEVLGKKAHDLEDSFHEYNALYRNRPFLKSPDMVEWLRDCIRSRDFGNISDNIIN
jgi:RNA polymerase sigma factor (sigma-70 family)